MFGAVIFLPVYLQLVKGASATASGLLLIPMMVGVLVTSISAGRIVSKVGRYRIFPIIGTILMAISMLLLTQLTTTTSYAVFSLYILVLGAGMGFCMQIVVLATQNSVDPTDIGTATSAVSFFRSMGGAFGTALFGAILNNRLAHWLGVLLPSSAGRHIDPSHVVASPAQFHRLPAAVQTPTQDAFVHALHAVFLVGTPIAAGAVVLALLLRDVRLRDTAGVTGDLENAPDSEFEAVGVGAVID
jgi:MFS family permease